MPFIRGIWCNCAKVQAPTVLYVNAGAVHLRVQREADVSNLGDLLLYSLDDLETIASEKGGIRHLLDEKWRKVYKAMPREGCLLWRRCEQLDVCSVTAHAA